MCLLDTRFDIFISHFIQNTSEYTFLVWRVYSSIDVLDR